MVRFIGYQMKLAYSVVYGRLLKGSAVDNWRISLERVIFKQNLHRFGSIRKWQRWRNQWPGIDKNASNKWWLWGEFVRCKNFLFCKALVYKCNDFSSVQVNSYEKQPQDEESLVERNLRAFQVEKGLVPIEKLTYSKEMEENQNKGGNLSILQDGTKVETDITSKFPHGKPKQTLTRVNYLPSFRTSLPLFSRRQRCNLRLLQSWLVTHVFVFEFNCMQPL